MSSVNQNSETPVESVPAKKPNKGHANIVTGARRPELKELGIARRAAKAAEEARRVAEEKLGRLTERPAFPEGPRAAQMRYVYDRPPAEGLMTQAEITLRGWLGKREAEFIAEMERLEAAAFGTQSAPPEPEKPAPDPTGAVLCDLIDKLLAEANE